MSWRERIGAWIGILRASAGSIVMTAGLIALMVGGGILVALNLVAGDGRLPEGSTINDVPVAGMDVPQAVEAVVAAYEPAMLEGVRLVVRAQGTEQIFTAEDLGASTDIRPQLQDMLAPFRGSGGLFARADAALKLRNGVQLRFSVVYDASAVANAADAFAKTVYLEPRDATLRIDSGTHEFVYSREENGQSIDASALAARMMDRLLQGVAMPIDVEPTVLAPAITQDTLRENIALLGEYQVELPAGEEDIASIRPLVEAINGAVMRPGEPFSLKEWLEAAGIELPQAEEPASRMASALYNAALLADAVKVDRSPLEELPEYVPAGLNAALSREKDLVLQCDAALPYYIVASIRTEKIHVEVYGRQERSKPQVRLRGVVDSTTPPTDAPLFLTDNALKKGQQELVTEAKDGCRISSYRDYYQGEVFLNSELLALDRYPPVQAVYRVGSRE